MKTKHRIKGYIILAVIAVIATIAAFYFPTFKQYFSKIKASFRLRELSPELKKKVLNLIENKILWDGRRIVIDYTNKIILIGNF